MAHSSIRLAGKLCSLSHVLGLILLDSGAGILVVLTQLIDVSAPVLLGMTCLMFLFGSPASSAGNLIASEIFPTATRPIVLSLIFVLGIFGGICGVWVDSHYISGALMLFGGLIGWLFCPAAEGKSLE